MASRRKRKIIKKRNLSLVSGLLCVVLAGLVGAISRNMVEDPGIDVEYIGTGEGSGMFDANTRIADVPVPTATPDAGVKNQSLKVNLNPDGSVKVARTWKGDQLKHAATIVDVGMNEMGMRCRAWIIAVATAMQESSLTNHGHLGAKNDHDSQGLFQQRPSQGWGTIAQVTDPRYASRKFYQSLKRKVSDYDTRRLTEAAQKVQISAYPEAYQKHERDAQQVVRHVLGLPQDYKFDNPNC